MILQIIGWACFGWLLTVAEPVLMIRAKLGLLDPVSGVQAFVVKLISCPMCISFWVGLIATQSLYTAAIISVLARVIDDRLGSVPLS